MQQFFKKLFFKDSHTIILLQKNGFEIKLFLIFIHKRNRSILSRIVRLTCSRKIRKNL